MTSTEEAALFAMVAEIREGMRDILDRLPIPETYTVPDLAVKRGVSASWLTATSAPWRLPNWGVPDEGEGKRRWRRETVLTWYASVTWETERREEWEHMTPTQRRTAIAARVGS
jgi:hypothetical protein